MVVHNFNFKDLAILPNKAYPPLLIDPDAMLPLPVSFQGLQAVAGGNS
jgi:hypothetical protein